MAEDGVDDYVWLLYVEVVQADPDDLHLGGHLPHLRFEIQEQAQIDEGGRKER